MIWLQIAAVFCLGGGIISQLLHIHEVNYVRQIEIHTAEPLVPEPNDVEDEIDIAKLKSHKSPRTDQILAEIIKAGV